MFTIVELKVIVYFKQTGTATFSIHYLSEQLADSAEETCLIFLLSQQLMKEFKCPSEPSERIPLQMGFVMKKLRKKGSFYSRVVSRHAASNELSILTK